LTGEFYQSFKEKIAPILLKKMKEEEILLTSFYIASITSIAKFKKYKKATDQIS